jgi:hypothetical protein
MSSVVLIQIRSMLEAPHCLWLRVWENTVAFIDTTLKVKVWEAREAVGHSKYWIQVMPTLNYWKISIVNQKNNLMRGRAIIRDF